MDVHELYRLTTQQEQTLKQVIRSRPTEIGEIEGLRNAIREAYVRLLFQDPTYAASKDMDQSLWKTCFYRKIEEFRKMIRKYAAAASNAESKAMAHKARAELHAVCAAFGEFIAEALTFYQDLMGRYERLQATKREEVGEEAGAGALEQHCVKSIHRCLIFLGDLTRYRELHSESTRKDWSQAEKWYYQAIDAMPTSGNPHNQLAVLATYTEAECVAVYRYCRALLCANPFPTAKENLGLLFEKNKQGMPDRNTDDGADMEEEEERVRQGLAAGTITGQQAGIARATMLKSLLQRFVHMHGMLFNYRQKGHFSVGEFMDTLHTALLDFRQLLKMSAFGDGLLLHMVAICVFSALISIEESSSSSNSSSSSTDEECDSSVQALSLSLAFGVVAEIAACVRTARQEPEHTTAKPPGSRLLGPVVVFCDWIWSRPSFWRLKSLGSSGVAGGPSLPEKEIEAAIREQFWRMLCKVATELQVQLLPGGDKVGAAAGVPEDLIWVPADGRVLKEQHDMRGFKPLENVYGKALMTKPKAALGKVEIVSDNLAATWRTMRLVKFLREVGVKSGVVAMTANPQVPACWVFRVKGRENVLAPAFAAQVGMAGQYYNNGGGMRQPLGGGASADPGRRGGMGGRMGGGREEEVIAFKPSFASPSGAGAALNGAQVFYLQQQQQQMVFLQQQQQQQHQRLPSLDDSSQLPKEIVESMLGGLLDCSDSGPHPNYLGSGRAPQGSGMQASGSPGGINTAGHVQPPVGPGTDSPRSSRNANVSQHQQHHHQQQQQQQQHQQQPAISAARFAEASSLDGGSSGLVGWNAFRPTGASMTPAPPGLAGSSAAALILGKGSYGLSMFSDSGNESEDDTAGLEGGSPSSLPLQMGYKPFGGRRGLLEMGGPEAGESGRESAPCGGKHLMTRNPFLTSSFGLAP